MAGPVAAYWSVASLRIDALGVFVRCYGLVLAAFAHTRLPSYIALLDNTALSFGYSPYHYFAVLDAAHLHLLRHALLMCGIGIMLGVCVRACLFGAFGLMAYFQALDRIIYNNHYFLMAELCVLLAVWGDEYSLSWPWPWPWHRRSTGPADGGRSLRYVRYLVLTPYFYGGIAKLNPDWLYFHQPIASWAEDMLTALDDALGGRLSRCVAAALPYDAPV